MRIYIFLFALFLAGIMSGCASIREVGKTVWGSSTRHLEKAREEALAKTYACSMDDCYETVIELSVEDSTANPPRGKAFDIFINNRMKGQLVVMGIPGNIDTTEVGIFFEPVGRRETKIEISSLSSLAKEKVARAVFAKLDSHFTLSP